MTHTRHLQSKGNEMNDKALLLLPAILLVDRQNQNNKKKYNITTYADRRVAKMKYVSVFIIVSVAHCSQNTKRIDDSQSH